MALSPEIEPGAGTAEQTTRPLYILLADDNVINQEVARRLLEGQGHRVDIVANGRNAVLAVGQASYDLVLMDIQMPEMDGLAASKAIRSLEGPAASVRIIALTANAVSGIFARCRAAGMNGVITKPIDRHELFRAIDNRGKRRAPRKRKPVFTSALAVDDVPVGLIDRRQIEDMVAGVGLETYRRLLKMAETESAAIISLIETLASNGEDVVALAEAAHSLKSVGNLGLLAAHDLAKTIEALARKGAPARAYVGLVADLRPTQQRALSAIRLLIEDRTAEMLV